MSAAGDLLPLTAETPPSVAAAVFVHGGFVGAHVGLAYFVDDLGEYRLLYQAWHHITSPKDRIDDHLAKTRKNLWWVVPGLDEYDLISLRSTINRVALSLEGRQLPYAFDRANASIDASGVIDLGTSVGLTCSTFAMLVFEAAKVALLDESTWETGRSPERKLADTAIYSSLVARLQDDPIHAKRIEDDVECVRVRAEEVAACSGCVARPVAFAEAEALGRALLTRL